MKKSELIALLAQYPDDMEIYLPFYEDGYYQPTEVKNIRVARYTGCDNWHGPFKEDDDGEDALTIE